MTSGCNADLNARGRGGDSVSSVDSGGSASLLSGDIGRGLETGYGEGSGVNLVNLDDSFHSLDPKTLPLTP